MNQKLNAIITGTGSFIPDNVIDNADFLNKEFYTPNSIRFEEEPDKIISKFKEITGIEQRRYADGAMTASDLASVAAKNAIVDSKTDPETIDHIILAHNFGDISNGTLQADTLPCLASKVKNQLGIQNPNCIAYDLIFGCPGWVQGMIQADSFIQSGLAKKCLVIGTETLSRVLDPFDRDSMIFADGAGACILEAWESDVKRGMISSASQTFAGVEAYYLSMGESHNSDHDDKNKYVKMEGRKIYEYALNHVPDAMKKCFDESGFEISQLRKILIHQANEKMDEAIVKRFFRLYGIREVPNEMMPMTIRELGNSSVATIPTLLDLIKKDKLEGHTLQKDDIVIFASVGAGMHINAFTYVM